MNCFCTYAASGNATTLPVATKNSRLFIRIPGSRLGILSLRAKPGEAANIWPAARSGLGTQFAFARLWDVHWLPASSMVFLDWVVAYYMLC